MMLCLSRIAGMEMKRAMGERVRSLSTGSNPESREILEVVEFKIYT
jgi:hypothetical protein